MPVCVCYREFAEEVVFEGQNDQTVSPNYYSAGTNTHTNTHSCIKYFCFEVSILCLLLLSAGDTAGSCGDPGIPSHGSREQTDFKIRSKVYFSCSEGFDLIGSSERMCFPNGTWSGTQPFCKRTNILLLSPLKTHTIIDPPSLWILISLNWKWNYFIPFLRSCPVWKPWHSK